MQLGTSLALSPEGTLRTSLEGTAQPGPAVPLVVTDGPVAAFGGRLAAVTPNTQLIPTALTVSGAELERGGKAQQPLAHGPGRALSPAQKSGRYCSQANPRPH